MRASIFRTIVEQSPISTQIFSATGDTIYVNAAWERLWGVSFAKLGAYNILQDQQLVEKGIMPYIQKAFLGEVSKVPAIKYEPQITIPGKSTVDFKWVEAVIYPIKNDTGEIAEVVLQHQDITDQKESEERILSHQERLELAQDAADIGTYERNLQTGVITLTPQLERLYGYEKGTMGNMYTAWSKHVHPDDLLRVQEEIQKATKEKRDFSVQFRITRKDNKHRWLLAKAKTIFDEQGNPLKHVGINMDITKQKEWEEQLRTSEAKFRQLFESNIIGIFTSTFDGTFLEANDAFLEMIGYTRAELEAKKIHRDAITPPEYREKSEQAVSDLKSKGVSMPYEKVYLHKKGKQIAVLIAVTRIGDSEMCIGYVLDISERKNLEVRKDEFISMASHELKTPVTSLKVFTQTLMRQMQRSQEEKYLLQLAKMEGQIDKLGRLITDLLDVSKINTGKLEIRKEAFLLDDLVKEVADNLQIISKRKVVVKDGVKAQVMADRDRITQVLVNFINNAFKYSPAEKAVNVALQKENGEVKVSVIDQGKGISKEYQDKIFERFYQVPETTQQTYPGLGLGLYIASEITKLHNGRIEVESAEGKGATFSLILPTTS